MAQDSPNPTIGSGTTGFLHGPRGGEESTGTERRIRGAEGDGLDDAVASVGGEARSGDEQAATNAGAARGPSEIPVLEGAGSAAALHPRAPLDSGPSHSHDRASFLSSISHRRRPHHRPVRVEHDYLYNPDLPQWNDDDWSYVPWPPETDVEVAYTLDCIAEPPHEGMLERADPTMWRRNITKSSSDEGRRVWENLMYFYDNAMMGKIRALNALIAAHRKIRHQDDHLKYLEGNLTDFHEEAEQLRKELKSSEKEQAQQQERIAALESENTRIKSRSLSTEAEHQQLLTAMEDQIASQDRIIARWESLGDVRHTWSDANIDPSERESRFRAVEAILKKARADAAYAQAQCDILQENYNELKEKLKEAIGSAKELREENASLATEKQVSEAMAAHWESQVQGLKSLIESKKAHAQAEEQKHLHEIERLTVELAELEGRVGGITDAQRSSESPTSESADSLASPAGRTLAEELVGVLGSQGGLAEDTSATISSRERHGEGLSDVGVDADNVVTRAVEEAIDLTSQLVANSLIIGRTEAARECIEKLNAIIEGLESTPPGTAARDVIVFIKESLKEMEKGMGSALTALELLVIDEHTNELRRLLEGQDPCAEEPGADEEILDSIWDKLDALEEHQGTQEALLHEYEVYCTEHPPIPLGATQSETLWQLTNSFLESHSQSRPSTQGQLSQRAVDTLLDRIQELTADEELTRRRQQLQRGIAQQDAQLAEVEAEIALFSNLINGIYTQIEVLDRPQEKQQSKPKADTEFNKKYRTKLTQREERLRREHRYFQGRLTCLVEHRSRIINFIKSDADIDRRRAQKLLNEILLKIQVISRPGRHGEAICFCTLVRFLFPRIYYSTLYGGCCAGGRLTPPSASLLSAGPATGTTTTTSSSNTSSSNTSSSNTTPPAGPSCHGHHGHGLLASSSRLYTLVCQFLTSLAWLVLLLLIQPYNLYTTAAFLLSALLGLHRYVYRVARHAYRQRRARRGVFPLPDKLHPVRAARRAAATAAPPPASAFVGSLLTLFLLFAWLSYVAVEVERRIWTADNQWRLAYLRDLQVAGGGAAASTTTAATAEEVAGYPYPAWSPFRVDYRLLAEPLWASFESRVHRWFIGGLRLGRVFGAVGAVGAWVGGLGAGVLKGIGAVKGWRWVLWELGWLAWERRYDRRHGR
ncbi:Hsp90 chaperone hsp82 [Madurella fahalii]|uniref:Hsp90 chaperone hsp82 n=1 Tax=Madurella fahalii TaxID=1157608 RepID=A0ABQ0G268_9PEZI